MIIAAIDLGKARTGIAVCDKTEFLASPYKVIEEKYQPKTLEKVAVAVKEAGAELLVVGLPKNMDGSSGERVEKTMEFKAMLERRTGLEIIMWDERLTTVSAHNYLNQTNTRGKKRKDIVDAVAATIILEDYLSFRKNKTT